ncbi:MAG: hypothetical protein VX278_00430, partial [Myxococcota bacterium]|nr:hypothetical protein [Myxococcota bacterium]
MHNDRRVLFVALLAMMACGMKEDDVDPVIDTDTGSIQDTDDDDISDTDEAYVYQPPSPAICDDMLETENGYLCAVRPSRLDEQARDIFASGELGDENLGFGYHAMAFPSAGTTIKGVYIHFTGSMGRPYHPRSQKFPSQQLLDEAMAAGFITLQIAYHNRYAVNSDRECIGSSDVDNCAGLVRYEKITGEDVSSVVDVPLADSIIQRIRTLVSYCNEEGFEFPVRMTADGVIQWTTLRLGGHSQGAGHALYITKYWDAAHACLLGGGYDVPDAVPSIPLEGIADWYIDASVAVDISKIRALVAVDDSSYDAFLRGYDQLGLEEGVHWASFGPAAYTDWE